MTRFNALIFLFILIASCTLTTTKPKKPVFADTNKVESELKTLISSEEFNLTGKEVTKNKKTSSELEVSIINGQNVPAAGEQQKALGKSIAACIKQNLKDANAFDTYKIVFVTKTQSGAVTKRSWTAQLFASTEL